MSDNLKEAYKVKDKDWSLFDYLLRNNHFDKPFHSLSKEEIISLYKTIVKEHLELLKNI
jgi:hypothetical protein